MHQMFFCSYQPLFTCIWHLFVTEEGQIPQGRQLKTKRELLEKANTIVLDQSRFEMGLEIRNSVESESDFVFLICLYYSLSSIYYFPFIFLSHKHKITLKSLRLFHLKSHQIPIHLKWKQKHNFNNREMLILHVYIRSKDNAQNTWLKKMQLPYETTKDSPFIIVIILLYV